MAIRKIPILGFATLPDSSGNVYFEPYAVNLGANDRFPHMVGVFLDSATRDKLGGNFFVPVNYVGTAKLVLTWATTATSGNARWEFDYTAIADGESRDTPADDESTGSTIAAPGTARLEKVTEIALTSANFSPSDEVQFSIVRNGAGADTIAASLYLLG